MKTKTVLLLFLLPIALFTPGVVNALDMEEYTDESFGFSVDYPAAWGIMPSPEGILFHSSAENEPGAVFMVTLIPLQDLDNFDANFLWEMITQDFPITSDPEQIYLGGLEGLYCTIDDQEDNTIGELFLVISEYSAMEGEEEIPNVYMIINAIHPSELEQDYQPILDDMIDSISFFPPKPGNN